MHRGAHWISFPGLTPTGDLLVIPARHPTALGRQVSNQLGNFTTLHEAIKQLKDYIVA
jgi:hypothetical protein